MSTHSLVDVLLERGQIPNNLPDALKRQVYERSLEQAYLDFLREQQVYGDARQQRRDADDDLFIRSQLAEGGALATVWQQTLTLSIFDGWRGVEDTTAGWVRRVPMKTLTKDWVSTIAPTAGLQRLPRGGTATESVLAGPLVRLVGARYARSLRADEQDLIDDAQTVALVTSARSFGSAARRLIPDLVYSFLLSNPTCPDDVALFDAAHVNTVTGALSESNLDSALAKLAGQTYTDEQGRAVALGLTPMTLLVPPALAGLARRLAHNMSLSGQELRVVVEGRIGATGCIDPDTGTVVAGADTAWYVIGDPAAWPCIVVGTLQNEPKVRAYRVDAAGQHGLKWDIHFDVSAACLDFRGIVKGSP